MKLLLDMNLSPRWASFLRELGWDSIHWSSVGRANASDAEIMQYAAEKKLILLTHDLDFGAILAVTHGSKPSVVQIRSEDVSPEGIGERIAAALRVAQSDLETGALLTIEPDRTRLRLLPLQRE
jgi:predicted nuclease of predicted toxin-antitoxin system